MTKKARERLSGSAPRPRSHVAPDLGDVGRACGFQATNESEQKLGPPLKGKPEVNQDARGSGQNS
jgi:hypothetical protein